MIVREVFETREDGVDLIRTYSDSGFMIIQGETGVMYAEAIDPEDMNRIYTESDVPIEVPEEEGSDDELGFDIDPEVIEKAEAYDIIMGVNE